MLFRTFSVLTLLLFCMHGTVLHADDNALLDKISQRLDAIERKFWRIAPLSSDHRSRPAFLTELHEFESLARKAGVMCVSYSKEQKPDLYGDAVMLSRCYDRFSMDSKVKYRNITLQVTSLKAYQRRHNKLMREKDMEEEADSGEKKKKNTAKYKVFPKLSKIDIDDYNDFLDDIADKNSRKFSSWLDSVKSREKNKTAQSIYESWQKSICNIRAKLVLMAKYGKFTKEKK